MGGEGRKSGIPLMQLVSRKPGGLQSTVVNGPYVTFGNIKCNRQ